MKDEGSRNKTNYRGLLIISLGLLFFVNLPAISTVQSQGGDQLLLSIPFIGNQSTDEIGNIDFVGFSVLTTFEFDEGLISTGPRFEFTQEIVSTESFEYSDSTDLIFFNDVNAQLTNGLDDELSFWIGFTVQSGNGIALRLEDGLETESDWLGLSPDFVGFNITRIILVVNNLSYTTDSSTSEANYDIEWQFYGISNDPILSTSDPTDIITSPTTQSTINEISIRSIIDPTQTSKDKPRFDFGNLGVLILLTLSITSGVGFTYFGIRRGMFRKPEQLFISEEIEIEMQFLFANNYQQMIDIGTTIYSNDELQDTSILDNLPSQIIDNQFLLHPTRLIIMKNLIEKPKREIQELYLTLGLTKKDIMKQFEIMEEEGLVKLSQEIENEIVKNYIGILKDGTNRFTELMEDLIEYVNYSDSIRDFLEKYKVEGEN